MFPEEMSAKRMFAVVVCLFISFCLVMPFIGDTASADPIRFANGGTAEKHPNGDISGWCYAFVDDDDYNITGVEVTMPDGRKLYPAGDAGDCCISPGLHPPDSDWYPFYAHWDRNSNSYYVEVGPTHSDNDPGQSLGHLQLWYPVISGGIEIQKGSSDIQVLDHNSVNYTLEDAVFGTYSSDPRTSGNGTLGCLTVQDDPTARWFKANNSDGTVTFYRYIGGVKYCLVAYNDSRDVGIWENDGTADSGHWFEEHSSDGSYVRLMSKKYPGFALNPNGDRGFALGSPMCRWEAGGESQFWWEIIANGDGTYRLKNKLTSTCLGLGNDAYFLKTDSTGYASVKDVPLGSRIIYELKPPKGHNPDPNPRTVNVNSGVLVFESYVDTAKLGSIAIDKVDASTNAKLGNVKFGIWKTQDAASSKTDANLGPLDGTFVFRNLGSGFTVMDVANASGRDGANIQGYTANWSDAQKWVLEPAGDGYYYIKNPKSGKVVDITGGVFENSHNVQVYTKNGTRAQKWKPTPYPSYGNGVYMFTAKAENGAEFALDLSNGSPMLGANVQIYSSQNLSNPKLWELVRDSSYVGSMTTDAAGHASFGNLPFGTYYVRELEAPSGYIVPNTIYQVTVDSEGVHTVKTSDGSDKIPNRKGEFSTVLTGPSGAKELSSSSTSVTLTDTITYSGIEPGTYTLKSSLHDQATGALLRIDGTALAKEETLNVTTYETRTKSVSFSINPSSLAGKKVVAYEQLVRTDGSGTVEADHSSRYDAAQTVSFPAVGTSAIASNGLHEVQAGTSITITDTVTVSNVTQGKKYKVKGMLLDIATRQQFDSDESQLREAPAETFTERLSYTIDNASDLAGHDLVCFATLVDENNRELGSHKSTTDANQIVKVVDIGTTAINQATGTHEQLADGTAVVTDIVHYTNLTPNKQYRIEGHLYDKATRTEISGVTGGTLDPFFPPTASGDVNVTFYVPATALEGKTYVAFETLSTESTPLAIHADIDDDAQTIYVPKMWTQASDNISGGKEAKATDSVTINDVVHYENLQVGSSYTVTGYLVDKASGNKISGTEKTSPPFRPDTKNGDYSMSFMFDARSYVGRAVVVYERILDSNGKPVAIHETKEDTEQTISFPSVQTSAIASNGLHEIQAGASITITDTVTVSNVTKNKKYRVKGQLIDKATGSQLAVLGGEATANSQLKPAPATTFTEQLSYTFNASNLAGKTIVCYATLEDENGTELGAHANINDVDQTIDIVDIQTTAINQETGTHEQLAEGNAIVTDTVHYINLTPGQTYTLKGSLHDKVDPNRTIPLCDVPGNGEKTFTAQADSSGKGNNVVEVRYTVPASELAGKTYVAYETLSIGGKTLAVHANANDLAQTIYVPKMWTQASDDISGGKEAKATASVTIDDFVSYENLQVGGSYNIVGYLVDGASGNKIAGTDKTVPLHPTRKDDSADMSFTFDARPYLGGSVVVFETIMDGNGKPVAKHESRADPAQTISFPAVTTSAIASNGLHAVQAGNVAITDTVTVSNATQGKKYKVKGTLYDKATRQPLVVTSGNVSAESPLAASPATTFSRQLTYIFNASDLAGKTVVCYATLVDENGVELGAHEDINDANQTIDIVDIGTTAIDQETGTHEQFADGSAVVIDTVHYTNLTPGKKYRIEGHLYDKTPPHGEIPGVTGGVLEDFEPQTRDGDVEIRFTVPNSALEGKTYVAYETLSTENKTLAVHADIDDDSQTIYVPKMRTQASDNISGGQEAKATASVTIDDSVSYENLQVGGSYNIVGYLVDGASGDKIAGTDKTVPLHPTRKDDSADMSFTFDARPYLGGSVVAFETIEDINGKPVAKHENRADPAQTISFPAVTTTAIASNGLHAVQAGRNVKIQDTVTVSNVTPNKKYKLKGRLIDKATGDQLVVLGGNATAETQLKAAPAATFTEQFTYTIDASNLAGKTVVCYATLEDENGVVLGAHEDIDEVNQTIDIVDIQTTAIDQETGSHEQFADGSAVVIDTVHYTNLTPGRKYRIEGHLYDKAEPHGEIPGVTGGVLEDFEPQTRDGDVEVRFTVPNSVLEGKTYVAFEKLFLDGRELAVHANIEDEDQTIFLPKVRTQARDSINDDNEVQASASVTVNDSVHYENLQIGQPYTISGYLVDRESGIKVPGTDKIQPISPLGKDGYEKLSFTFDARPYIGHDVVAFETLKDARGKTVGQHMDVTDANQTVHVIDITTTATDKELGLHETQASSTTVITDKVDYVNLTVGNAYTMEGVLVDKAAPDTVLSTATQAFSPTQKTASISLDFPVDTSVLEGHDLVVFETLKKDGKTYAVHQDVGDASQTVHVVNIHTRIHDRATALDECLASETSTIVDEVDYVNLTPGQSYTVSGYLVDFDTGETLQVNGADLLETRTFVPETPNGTWEVEFEIPSKLLAGRSFVAFERLDTLSKQLAFHHDIASVPQTFNIPDIRTTALDGETHEQIAAETAVITDTVAYTNLQPGKEYKVSGTLMLRKPSVSVDEPDAPDDPGNADPGDDGQNGGDQQGDTPDPGQPAPLNPGEGDSGGDSPQWQAEPLGGDEPVTATTIFTPEERNGTVDVVFELDSSMLKGETIVVFEEISRNDSVVAVHADITDEEQAVYIPEIQTQATATSDGTHQHFAVEVASITDKVSYRNLQPGKEYAMHGTLMDNETGTPLLDADGAEIKVDKAFVPEEPDGEIELVFEFDASLLDGHTLVAFERLEHDGKDVAAHEDITDEEQSVHFPKIRTLAIDSKTGEHISGEFDNRKIVDTVSYANLDPAVGYTLVGVLMDKDTGKQIEDDGKPVTATKDFEVVEADGNEDLEFDFDATELGGHVVVVFESLYRTEDDVLIAEHADIDDADQSVNVPKIGTKAAEKGTGNKEIAYADEITVVDVVSYENLVPGKEYKVSGHMVDKDTGKEAPSGASTAFSPDQADGSVEVEMVIDAKGLDGHSLVAFEELYLEDEIIAEHKDLEDADQTVSIKNMDLASDLVKRIADSTPIARTDDGNAPLGALLFALATVLAASVAFAVRKKTARKK